MPTLHESDDAMAQLQSLRFDRIVFPYRKIRAKGGVRKHVHEYPHVAGGVPEKLGRTLYEFDVTTSFQNSFVDAKWQDLYPLDLIDLMKLFEAEATKELVVPLPGIGSIQAYCTSWTRDLSARLRSGEMVELHFLEDQSDAILTAERRIVQGRTLATAAATLEDTTREIEGSIFDTITDLSNSLFAYLDTGDMIDSLVAAKIDSLTQIISEADQTIRELNDPKHWKAKDALLNLWETLVNLKEDTANKGAKIREFTTVREMSIVDVAVAIYRDASKAEELRGLNAAYDLNAIPAGTVIRFYEENAPASVSIT